MGHTGRPLLLRVDGVEVIYNQAIVALRGVSLDVHAGDVVSLLGANGAGKSTTLKAISGVLGADRGEVVSGSITFDSTSLVDASPHDIVRRGLVQVLEGRHCFPSLSVEENLVSGAIGIRLARGEVRKGLERIYAYFPRLAQLRRKAAGYASGGEQQMVAIGRALMAQPRLVLLDEPSMGLAPQIIDEIFTIVQTLNRKEGVSFLLAEQNATQALRYADHAYILENGTVAASGSGADIASREDVKRFYLGVGDEGRRSFRDRRFDRRPSPPEEGARIAVQA